MAATSVSPSIAPVTTCPAPFRPVYAYVATCNPSGASVGDEDHAQQFLDGRHTLEHLLHAVVAQQAHAVLLRRQAQLVRRGAAEDQPAQPVVHHHELEHAEASAVSRTAAEVAAAAAVQAQTAVF